MRRLVVEFSADQFFDNVRDPTVRVADWLEKVRSLEMLYILKMVPGEFAAVARIELRDPTAKVEEISPWEGPLHPRLEVELLDKESETVSTIFIRVKSDVRPGAGWIGQGGLLPYPSTPFEYRNGKLRVTFVGTSSQIKRYLANLGRQSRLRYRVITLTDAKFPPNSPLARLTDKQRRVLLTAYKLGYYDVPRRISTEEVAGKLDLVKSTFSAHVRKAERRLLTEMLSEL